MIDLDKVPEIYNSIGVVGAIIVLTLAFLFVWAKSITRERRQDEINAKFTERVLDLLAKNTESTSALNVSISALTIQSQANVQALKALAKSTEKQVSDVLSSGKKRDDKIDTLITHQEALLKSLEGLKTVLTEDRRDDNGRFERIEKLLGDAAKTLVEVLTIVKQIASEKEAKETQEVIENGEKPTTEQPPMVVTGTGTDLPDSDSST